MKKALYILAFLSFWSGFSISIAGFHAKYDQLFIILIFCVLVLYKLMFGGGVYIDKGGFLLIFLCLISLFSSYFNAPDPTYSLTQTVNLFSVSLAYFVFPNVLTSYEDISNFIRVLLRIAIIWLMVSVLLFLFSYSTNTPMFGVTLAQNEAEAFGVYATMVEPNIFGSFMLIIFFLAFSLYFSETQVERITKSELYSVMIWSALGIFISFTRGVWLAAIVGVFIYYTLNSRNVVKTLRQIGYFSIGVLLLLYVTSEVLEIEFVKYKVTNFLSSERGTGLNRLWHWGQALKNWSQQGHVFTGTGTYSYATFFNVPGGYAQERNAWISNVYLSFLHDTGLIGLMTYLFFYGHLALLTLRTRLFKYLTDYGAMKDLSMGLFLALVGIGIAFFFTTALTCSYPWILFGLVSAFSRVCRRNQQREQLKDSFSIDR